MALSRLKEGLLRASAKVSSVQEVSQKSVITEGGNHVDITLLRRKLLGIFPIHQNYCAFDFDHPNVVATGPTQAETLARYDESMQYARRTSAE